MGLKEGSFAKLWSAKKNGKLYSVQVSVSKKVSENKYENTFSGFVNFGGAAAQKIEQFNLPEVSNTDNPVSRSVKITTSPDVGTFYNKKLANQRLPLARGNEELEKIIKASCKTTTVTIWDFEMAEGSSNNTTPTPAARANTKPNYSVSVDDEEEELPF